MVGIRLFPSGSAAFSDFLDEVAEPDMQQPIMTEALIAVFVLIVGIPIFLGVRRWHRRQKAARLADVLLADVLKTKDTYRR
jgi:hypothetical protein